LVSFTFQFAFDAKSLRINIEVHTNSNVVEAIGWARNRRNLVDNLRKSTRACSVGERGSFWSWGKNVWRRKLRGKELEACKIVRQVCTIVGEVWWIVGKFGDSGDVCRISFWLD
jgi:hypothetical protein